MRLLLFVFFFYSAFTFANNGTIAYCYPMKHVKIDGDLSDWPSNLEKYPIKLVSKRGVSPNSKKDFNAYFMVGYNLANHSIYLAVKVTDESFVIDYSENPEWSQQDKHLLYLDPKHSKRGSCPIAYASTPIKREMGGSDFSWDSQVVNAKWDNVALQISRQDGFTIYEYKIELESLSANTVIGLDHVFYDKDITDKGKAYSYVMWGKTPGKSGAPNRVGDLVLLEKNTVLAQVKGTITYPNKTILTDKIIRITSKENPSFWVSTKIDSFGNYNVKLPYGNYYLNYQDAFIQDKKENIRIDDSNIMPFSVSKPNEFIKPFDLKTLFKPKLNKNKGILHNFTSKKEKLLDDYMQKMMHYYAIPGASIGIITNGKLRYTKTYGVKSALTQEPVDENTIFQAASITKPVFAYTVLRLVDKGVIDLDKPLYKYLTFKQLENDNRYKKMTARHVLSHQSGLPNWGRKLIFEPGTSYGYSGEGFEYLKRVVEHITKKSIIDILDEDVLLPFNMTKNTYFIREQEMYPKVALGHHHNLPANNVIINQVGMARSMYTEPREFSKFILGFVNGKGLSNKMKEELFKSQTIMPKNPDNPLANWQRSFGLGVLIKKSPFGKVYGHGGSNRYFQSLFEYYVKDKMGFVVFCNNDMGYYLANDLRAFLIIGK